MTEASNDRRDELNNLKKRLDKLQVIKKTDYYERMENKLKVLNQAEFVDKIDNLMESGGIFSCKVIQKVRERQRDILLNLLCNLI